MRKINMDCLQNEVSLLAGQIVVRRIDFPAFQARYERYVTPDEYHVESDWFTIRPGESWRCAFRTTLRLKGVIDAPECACGQALALEINVGGEASVKVNGVTL